MCEFKVILNGEKISEDVIFAVNRGGVVILRDIIGDEVKVENAEIVEVNVLTTQLVLNKREG